MTATVDIYIAHALTKARPEFRFPLEKHKEKLEMKRHDWRFLKFFGLGKLSPDEDWKISRQDFQNVITAHLLVDVVDDDSTGMGREAGMRIAFGLPILSISYTDWERTRMVTGPPQDWPQYCLFRRYQDFEEIEALIEEAIAFFKIDPHFPHKPLAPAPHIDELHRKAVGLPPSNCLFGKEAPIYQA